MPSAKHFGRTEPRFWTKPLRPLTPETSLGFEVIDFAREILGIALMPWQQWLCIHGLELLANGEYRFRRIIVGCARQQGKTTLASVLAAWWLYVESARRPDRVPPMKFKVVGVAQNLDIAREPWSAVKLWCDPKPETAEDAELAIEALQDATAKVTDTNGKESIVARSRAHYEIRAAKNARGKPAARVLMDEMREQKDWAAWNAVSQTTKSFWNGQLWGFSNAGDPTAVVLIQQREAGLADIADWEAYVEAGLVSAEDYANTHDVSLGLFEWSAPDGCAKDDIDGILQANPSIGYGVMTVASALADIRGMTDAGYRTEVLCQWVTSREAPFIDPSDWRDCADPDSEIAAGARSVLGIAVSGNRSMSFIGVAGGRADGLAHLELIAQRAGDRWVEAHMIRVREVTGINEVAIQASGCPAADLIEPLRALGFVVHEIRQTNLLNSAGRLRERVMDERLRHRGQPALNISAENGTTKDISNMPVWDLFKSPVDVAPINAVTNALYALEQFPAPEVKKRKPLPPAARVVRRSDVAPDEVDLRSLRF